MNLAAILKQARIGKYTQTELAMCLGISQPNYANIENGYTQPSAETIIKLARILNLDLNRLVANIDPMPFYKIVSDHRQAKVANAQRKVVPSAE